MQSGVTSSVTELRSRLKNVNTIRKRSCADGGCGRVCTLLYAFISLCSIPCLGIWGILLIREFEYFEGVKHENSKSSGIACFIALGLYVILFIFLKSILNLSKSTNARNMGRRGSVSERTPLVSSPYDDSDGHEMF